MNPQIRIRIVSGIEQLYNTYYLVSCLLYKKYARFYKYKDGGRPQSPYTSKFSMSYPTMAKNTKAKATKRAAQRKSKRIHDDLRRQLENRLEKVKSEKDMLESQNSDNKANPTLQEKITRLGELEKELRAAIEVNRINQESNMDVNKYPDRSDGDKEPPEFKAEPKLKQTKDKSSSSMNNTLVTLADLTLDGLDGAKL